MNIAIVDDRETDRQAAVSYINKYAVEKYPDLMSDFTLETFPSAEAFLEDFKPGKFNLIIFDIYMVNMTGMEAAEEVRLQDEKVPIVFLTSSKEHMLEGYRVFAAGYILKPIADNLDDFLTVMDFIFPQLLKSEDQLSVIMDGSDINLPMRKIVYLNINSQHKLCIHMDDRVMDTVTSYNSCSQMLLLKENFVECHHRIIINMDYVKRMDKDFFIMNDGTQIPISQRRQKDTKAAYMHYMVHR
ncbi:MAG: LytTR family DNA-binding domain-containing protein [Anaerovibrio sp.]|uniref:LytR/AlgR family response regulator transcription factor n=1 Tax=Anaerovibrio sp. TaxID=1872532 RepID=UPI0025FBFBD7|nr:LytTR family DNA-binding domain-containing protein [Anaerovibrio sp.]MCR5176993.1 LytTR family DNA-binding domain-containing protein [Anaerovibrio sp.]